MDPVLVLNARDDVGVALRPLNIGERVRGISVQEAVPEGHKVALKTIRPGQAVYKYGHPIGVAKSAIEPGQWVHAHNLASGLKPDGSYTYEPVSTPLHPGSVDLPNEFWGYVRDDGQVGTRNEIWIINTVGCVNKTAERLAALAEKELAVDGVDGFYTFSHPYGCSQLGDDLTHTQKILAALVRHPNAAGVLVLGLGCESNRIADFSCVVGSVSDRRVKYLTVQEVEDEWTVGLTLLTELRDYALSFRRQPIPVSRLTMGLKCGGSDGFSGISANPLVGLVAERVVARGGTALLTEVPEMFGAETLLMNRAHDEATFEKVVTLIDDFKQYYVSHHQPVYENPSPGNKDGGITTLEEKSLGCIQKGGQCPVVDVLDYAEAVRRPGLNLVQAPGNDPVSVTALVGAGAQVVLFTTGRGTPMGGPVPTVKVATNSALAQRKPQWIDFDAGRLFAGDDLDSMADELYRLVIDVASGRRKTRNEEWGFREIAIFKDGVTL
ncbi:altronate hydrolase [Sulfobacillus acidophilus TPY]|uniref:D-altronate dehydratase n=1 Tax=Sulfobacillus acidophilus (strain ATCC 700253 / DSM 10332 / NAL) TaxID=679936 RepID=G8TTI2_SULAD|nr:altronate hydrolase [Sulfobacillus acidophilus TPY]AEW05648.1 D-altronate dehydratase [Sulfobacillus acidophilus DSM 10332]